MQNLISIIIPAYNIAPYIERCLLSAMSQTHNNLEIIVVNDGSTDETGQIIDRIAETDERFIVIHKENTGVSDTRNRGLDIAKGDYIGFADGDDEAHQDMYEFLLKNAKKYNADISHCGFELVNPNRTIEINGTGKIVVQDRNEAISSLLGGKLFEPGTWNKLYRREILNTVRYPIDIKINEDLLFNVEAFKNCKCSVFEDVVKYRYMYNSSSAARSGFEISKLKNVLTVAKRVQECLDDEVKLRLEVDRFYAEKILNVYRAFYVNGVKNIELFTELKKELRHCKGFRMGKRFLILRALLLDFPWLYDFSRIFYDRLFSHRQKWKVPEHE